MSSPLNPLAELPHLARIHNDMADFTLPPLSSSSDTYRPRDSFTSLPASSSPPRTPFNTKTSYDYAHIRTSPQLGPGTNFAPRNDSYEDSHMLWQRLGVPHTHFKTQRHPLSPLMPRSAFMHKQRYSMASDYGASDYSENLDTDFDDTRSDLPSRNPAGSASPLSNTHDEEQDNSSPGFSFSELGIFTMSFRTSAERGRWRTDPMPYRQPLLPTRKSAPAAQEVPDLLITSRPISEPAPSIPASAPSPSPVQSHDRTESSVPEVTSAPSPAVTLPSLPTSPAPGSMELLPPLTSDRDSSMDVDELLTPSSPLPPSSPPPLSPAVSLARLQTQSTSPSPICSRSSSPLPFVAPSSPLSPCSSEIGEGEDDVDLVTLVDEVLTNQTVEAAEPCESISDQDGPSATSDLDLTPTPHDHLACALPHTSKLLQTDVQVTCNAPLPSPLLNPKCEEAEEDLAPRCTFTSPTDGEIAANSPNSPKASASLPLSDDAVIFNTIAATPAETSSKRPLSHPEHTSSDNDNIDGPPRKRPRTSDAEDKNEASQNAAPSTSTSPVPHEATKAKVGRKKKRKDPMTSDAPPSSSTVPTKQRKRKPKYIVEESASEESESDSSNPSSTTSSRRSSPVRRRPKLIFPDDGIQRDQNGIAEEDGEICGMMIEGMATSRASSLPISQICKIVLQSRPSMKAEKSEKEWRGVFDRVLKSGVTGSGSGVFGKVDSSYKDENDPAVEARWFYVPEMDCDQERAALIRSMMPRPGKRNVTKKYKQYYYQPLDKISRWDPEDDL